MKLTALIVSVLLVHSLVAQSKTDKLYVFDKNWKGTDIKNAVYFIRVRTVSDKEFQWTTYQMIGPRISQETFQDEGGKVRNGYCRYYHSNGYLDSVGTYENDLPDGSWWYYNNDGVAIRKKDYNKGLFVKDSVIVPVPKDSVPKAEADPGEVESIFKGGQKGWIKFMNSNFKYPERAQNSNVEGMVWLEFIVDEKGNIQHPEINKSAEYSLDEEALRLINVSPAWIPASKDGKIVKSYKRQPIIFKLTAN